MRRQFAMFVMIAATCAAVAPAALAADKDENPTIQIRLHPAAAPCPALKYELLPPLLDRRSGNAVQYLKAPTSIRGCIPTRSTGICSSDGWNCPCRNCEASTTKRTRSTF